MLEVLPNSVQILEFDSRLFGFLVGRISAEALVAADAPETFARAKAAGIGLLYCESAKELELSALDCGVILKHVDKKTRFVKKLAPPPLGRPPNALHIEEYVAETPSDALVNLALSSGELSRFKLDERVPKVVFEKLYKTWLLRSIRHQIADLVLVARDANDLLLGMITVGCVRGRGDIGLLAVAQCARGRGVGRALMASAEAYTLAKGAELIQVVTQGVNVPACRLYKSAGYSVEVESHVYHVWPVDQQPRANSKGDRNTSEG